MNTHYNFHLWNWWSASIFFFFWRMNMLKVTEKKFYKMRHQRRCQQIFFCWENLFAFESNWNYWYRYCWNAVKTCKFCSNICHLLSRYTVECKLYNSLLHLFRHRPWSVTQGSSAQLFFLVRSTVRVLFILSCISSNRSKL